MWSSSRGGAEKCATLPSEVRNDPASSRSQLEIFPPSSRRYTFRLDLKVRMARDEPAQHREWGQLIYWGTLGVSVVCQSRTTGRNKPRLKKGKGNTGPLHSSGRPWPRGPRSDHGRGIRDGERSNTTRCSTVTVGTHPIHNGRRNALYCRRDHRDLTQQRLSDGWTVECIAPAGT